MDPSSDQEKDVFVGHPYSSPSNSSENDDEDSELDLDFSVFAGVNAEASQPISLPEPEDPFEPDEELPEWCKCGNCTKNCPLFEALCCNDNPDVMERLQADGDCIIDNEFFSNITSEEGLQFSRIIETTNIVNPWLKQRYLSQEFTNNLKRNMSYRNFVVWINQHIPMGRGNRMVIPRCVVLKIRQLYPDEQNRYTGFRQYENR